MKRSAAWPFGGGATVISSWSPTWVTPNSRNEQQVASAAISATISQREGGWAALRDRASTPLHQPRRLSPG